MIRTYPCHTDGLLAGRELSVNPPPEFPFADAQTPDAYPRRRTRTVFDERRTYTPRLHQRTSYSSGFTYTDDFSNAAWTKNNATATANQLANPADGAVTGCKLVETAATGAHSVARSFTFTATPHVLRVFASALARDWIRLLANDGTEDFEGWVNLTTGATKPFADIINATTLNGGMETAGAPLGSWSIDATGTSAVTRDTTVFSVGTASCKIVVDASGNYANVFQSVLTHGRTYRYSLLARHNGSGGTLNILGTDQVGTHVLTSSWARYTGTFVANATGLFAFGCATASATIYVDGVELTPLTAPAILNATTLNGGMETAGAPLGSWSTDVTGTSAVTRNTSVFNSGTASCRIVVDASGNYANVLQSILTPGRSYRYAIWAKHSGSGGTLNVLGTAQVGTHVLTSSWARYTGDFTADSVGIFAFGCSTPNATIYVDDVSLAALPPTITLTACPVPGQAWWDVALFLPWVRASAGSVAFALSSDGTTLSYTGDTAKGVYLWRANCRPGTIAGPAVPALGTILSISAPDLDAEDPFAYLVAEASPASYASDLVTVPRTYARIPGQQTTRDYRSFSRPNPSGLKSGSTYAASLDKGESFHLWTSRKSVLSSTNNAGTTTSNALPSGTVTVTLSDASTASFAANASKATIDAALAAVVGVYPNKLASCYSFVSSDNTATTIYWSYWAGGPTVSSVVGPSGTNITIVGASAQIRPVGVTITPDTKLLNCPSHGTSVGELCALWNGSTLLATASVAGVTDTNYLAVVLSDLSSPDFNITHITFAAQATLRYAAGAKSVRVKVVRDHFLPGVTMLSGGTIMADLDSIPDVITYDSPQGWLDRLVAGATSVAISSSDIGQEIGPIAFRDVTYVILDSSTLQSLSLT